MKIVIVDDDIFVSGALTTTWEASEKITVAATGSDGKEAVELYRVYQPDVLLVHIRMKEKADWMRPLRYWKNFLMRKSFFLLPFLMTSIL